MFEMLDKIALAALPSILVYMFAIISWVAFSAIKVPPYCEH
jgi:hypothetical protein